MILFEFNIVNHRHNSEKMACKITDLTQTDVKHTNNVIISELSDYAKKILCPKENHFNLPHNNQMLIVSIAVHFQPHNLPH